MTDIDYQQPTRSLALPGPALLDLEPGLSVVVPVFDSEATLPKLIESLAVVLPELLASFEVILVNDGSRDSSWSAIECLANEYSWVQGVNMRRNYGQHNALLCGIRRARFDRCLTMDDDLQHPSDQIPKLLSALDDEADVVYGSPIQGRHGFLRNVASRVTKLALQTTMGAETARKTSAFRLFRTQLRQAFEAFKGPFVSIDVLLTWSTNRFCVVAVRHDERQAGESNYTFRMLLRHAINMATGFSTLPLQVASWIGFAMVLFGLGVFSYVIGRYLVLGYSVDGFPFLASIIAIFAGAQLFALGIIGEYLARMHFRLMDRPAYSVQQTTSLLTARAHAVSGMSKAAASPADPATPVGPDRPGRIPFTRVKVLGNELAYVQQAVDSGQLAGDGHFTRACEELLAERLGVETVLLTSSGTHALEMSALLLDIGPEDEVILPSFTFVSCANAFVLRGATPRFVEVQPDTLNLDPNDLLSRINERTRAIVVVHYGGVAADMDAIAEIADPRGIAIIEDNAHGLFGTYKGRPLGSMGSLGVLSFHGTKNLSCGEGGALIVNDPALAARAAILREKGTNRRAFMLGQVDKYSWVDVGSSYLPSELQAAFLLGQLEARGAIAQCRGAIWDRYQEAFSVVAAGLDGLQIPSVPPDREPAHHAYFLILPTTEQRDAFIVGARERGIVCPFHYVPLHTSPMGNQLGYRAGDLPITEDISRRLVRLPLFAGLDRDQQDEVISFALDFLDGLGTKP